ncbi:hypothetical protein [Paenibacillus oleatilyticus]|uniref:Uncharacterized protein n=1 Tax=Paenibacillus oleatilyticus TaxID=2594886 RepID=A0ABV4V727_9BACL|nr:hypothetical protein [Paenibacillus oleatilyticus]MBU7320083.1 hypothetical protein [Paenibacillus oleatilyticus]
MSRNVALDIRITMKQLGIHPDKINRFLDEIKGCPERNHPVREQPSAQLSVSPSRTKP